MTQSDLIFWTALTGIISALATGLGAIPVHFLKTDSKRVRGICSAVAAGMMISASVFSLAQEGIALEDKIPLAPYIVIVGLLLGAAFLRLVGRFFPGDESGHHHHTGFTRRSNLMILAMFMHSIPEGIAIGVAFATGHFHFGLIMAIAISVHNIPEGIAISLPLKADGVSTKKCALVSIFTSIPQPILAVPSALLAWFFEPFLPIGLGFAGGAMIYITMAELIPDALEEGGRTLTAWGVMAGLCGMLLITTLLKALPY